MRILLKILLLSVTFIGSLGFSMYIGLWWMTDFTQGNRDASLLRATLILAVATIMFHKIVVVQRNHHTPMHFYFYSVLAVCVVGGYLYGVIFR